MSEPIPSLSEGLPIFVRYPLTSSLPRWLWPDADTRRERHFTAGFSDLLNFFDPLNLDDAQRRRRELTVAWPALYALLLRQDRSLLPIRSALDLRPPHTDVSQWRTYDFPTLWSVADRCVASYLRRSWPLLADECSSWIRLMSSQSPNFSLEWDDPQSRPIYFYPIHVDYLIRFTALVLPTAHGLRPVRSRSDEPTVRSFFGHSPVQHHHQSELRTL